MKISDTCEHGVSKAELCRQCGVPAASPEVQVSPDDKYEPFTVELSKPADLQVGAAIGLNCPDDQIRLHKILAVRDKGDYYEADVELLLKPASPVPLADPEDKPATPSPSLPDAIKEIEAMRDELQSKADAAPVGTLGEERFPLLQQVAALNEAVARLRTLSPSGGDAVSVEARQLLKDLASFPFYVLMDEHSTQLARMSSVSTLRHMQARAHAVLVTAISTPTIDDITKVRELVEAVNGDYLLDEGVYAEGDLRKWPLSKAVVDALIAVASIESLGATGKPEGEK